MKNNMFVKSKSILTLMFVLIFSMANSQTIKKYILTLKNGGNKVECNSLTYKKDEDGDLNYLSSGSTIWVDGKQINCNEIKTITFRGTTGGYNPHAEIEVLLRNGKIVLGDWRWQKFYCEESRARYYLVKKVEFIYTEAVYNK